VELEKLGRVQFLISQNVDGFHIASGFPLKKLAELHGNARLMVCLSCKKKYTKEEIKWDERIYGPGYRTSMVVQGQPKCPACKGRIISSIVNFGDPLPEEELETAFEHSRKSDLFIVLGSSLVVHPAAKMAAYAKQNKAILVINNKGETPYDNLADLLVPFKINDFFPPVVKQVKQILQKGGKE
jgi:NAD-dependent deacetylase